GHPQARNGGEPGPALLRRPQAAAGLEAGDDEHQDQHDQPASARHPAERQVTAAPTARRRRARAFCPALLTIFMEQANHAGVTICAAPSREGPAQSCPSPSRAVGGATMRKAILTTVLAGLIALPVWGQFGFFGGGQQTGDALLQNKS